MSADRLRQAAQKIRETANAAAYGQWHKAGDLPGFLTYEDATHIAFWSPSVALAVADSLDDAATDLDRLSPGWKPRESTLRLVDLILGGAQ
jgi:hypothetical protein